MDDMDEASAAIRAQMLAAYGLEPWEIGEGDPPPGVVPVIDWRSWNEAERRARALDEAYAAALPARVQEIAEQISEGLPGGLRLEWGAHDGE